MPSYAKRSDQSSVMIASARQLACISAVVRFAQTTAQIKRSSSHSEDRQRGEKRCRNTRHPDLLQWTLWGIRWHRDVPGALTFSRPLWGGSARDGRPRLIDYQEAGTGIWGSSVHYRKGEYMRAVMNEDLSSY